MPSIPHGTGGSTGCEIVQQTTWIIVQVAEGPAARFAYLSRFNQPGSEFARGLYRSVALLTVTGLGSLAFGVAATPVAADTQA